MKTLKFTALFFLLISTSVFAAGFKTTVVKIINGNSVVINTKDGKKTIQIAGYLSPQPGQEYFDSAKKLLSEIIDNKPVTITYLRGSTSTARLTPENNRDIPISFIASGLGRTTEGAPTSLKALQKTAKLKKIGMWKHYNQLNDFRSKKKHTKSISIKSQQSRSSFYGISAADIPRDPDGTAVGDGGQWMIAYKTGQAGRGNSQIEITGIAGEEAPVTNSFWDGSVRQVEKWLDKNLKDPKSFDAIEWSKVFKTSSKTIPYGVRCRYRARNSFGGMNISHQVFYFDAQGNVVTYEDIK